MMSAPEDSIRPEITTFGNYRPFIRAMFAYNKKKETEFFSSVLCDKTEGQ